MATSVGRTSLVNRLTTRPPRRTTSAGMRPRAARIRSRSPIVGTWFYHRHVPAAPMKRAPRRGLNVGGPSTPDDRVLLALTTPVIGQFDPAFTAVMDEVMQLARAVFLTQNTRCFPISALPSAGLEALFNTLVQ